MTAKRKRKKHNKKRIRTAEHSFKPLTIIQYDYLFNAYIENISIFQISEVIGKSEQSIEMAWRRLMFNASNKDYMKVYELKPWINTRKHLNQNAQDYIKIQYTDVNINETPETLARRMGFSVQLIKAFIAKMGWVPGRKREGLIQ